MFALRQFPLHPLLPLPPLLPAVVPHPVPVPLALVLLRFLPRPALPAVAVLLPVTALQITRLFQTLQLVKTCVQACLMITIHLLRLALMKVLVI